MGRLVLVMRLALRDLRRRRMETALLVFALLAATTTLTLGLVLRAAAAEPYQGTREATAGPDVVAGVGVGDASPDEGGLPALEALVADAAVTEHSGPFPVAAGRLTAAGKTSDVQAVGRDSADAAVDRPTLVDGTWTRDGGAVVEAAFAAAMGLEIGDRVDLAGRSLDVVGVAVTAAAAPYPQATCFFPCAVGALPDDMTAAERAGLVHNPGLVWLTEADVAAVAAQTGWQAWVLNLRLVDAASAPAFVDAFPDGPMMHTWQEIQESATELARDAQIVLVFGSSLLGLLAVASVAVLVGGRMADQTRRVGLLKAVGATPALVAAVLLAQHVVVAVVAAALGLALGSLAAPALTGSTAGLVGSVSPPALTPTTVTVVLGVALAVAVLATVVPALRAARTSTLGALADAARPPRRSGGLIRVSAHLPAPLMLAARVAARRPRRVFLGVASIAVTVAGIVVALAVRAEIADQQAAGGLDDARAESLMGVVVLVTAVLFALAAVNAVFLTWATALDNRRPSALARALGATPREVTTALAGAQVLPALLGALLGVVPGSIVLFAVINAINTNDNDATLPPLWQLVTLVTGAVLVVAGMTLVPARLAARRSVAEALGADAG